MTSTDLGKKCDCCRIELNGNLHAIATSREHSSFRKQLSFLTSDACMPAYNINRLGCQTALRDTLVQRFASHRGPGFEMRFWEIPLADGPLM